MGGIQQTTLPIDRSIGSDQVGRIGENFVAYHLERRGIRCSIVDRKGSDIWCCMPSGDMFRIEVKSSRRPLQWSNKHDRSPAYHFSTRNKDVDFFVLVALDIERLLIWPTATVRNKSIQVRQSVFNQLTVDDSIDILHWYYPSDTDAMEIYNDMAA